MRLVRSVHDVLQVFPDELEELLEHLLNLRLLERPHDALGSSAPHRTFSRAWAADWVERKTMTRSRSRDLVGERGGYARSRVRQPEAAAVKCRRRDGRVPPRPIPGICEQEPGGVTRASLRALIPSQACAGDDGGRGNRRWPHHRRCRVEPVGPAGGRPQPGCHRVRGQPRLAGAYEERQQTLTEIRLPNERSSGAPRDPS